MTTKEILRGFLTLLKEDKKLFLYIIYYSIIEGVLILSFPLAIDLTVNSIIAHASYSVVIIGLIIMVLFIFVALARVAQQYIVEKFQQKIFVEKAIEIFENAHSIALKGLHFKEPVRKVMNYFFDITTLQKFFPTIMLEGTALVVNIVVGFLLLLAFNPILFELAFITIVIYAVAIVLLGFNGVKYAKLRSDLKHETIYFLQNTPFSKNEKEKDSKEIDEVLSKYVDARKSLFQVMIRQKTLSFFMQGLIYTLFFIVGGFLVINGKIPVGEFIAAEIIIVFMNKAITSFVKQIDYFYEIVEGVYKIHKLDTSIGIHKDEPI